MEATEIQTAITLSKVAAGTIPFAAAVERAYTGYDGTTAVTFGAGARVYGGRVISDCQTLWTAGTAHTTVSLQTAAFDIYEGATPKMVRLTQSSCLTTEVMGYTEFDAINMDKDTYIYILMKSDTAWTTAGHCKIGTDETASFASPNYLDLPAMAAGVWYYHRVAITTGASDLNAVISVGLQNASGGTRSDVVDVQYVGSGNNAYGILGFAKDDQTSIHSTDNVPDEDFEMYDDVTVLAAGHINPYLEKGKTCIAGQPLYVLPGSGKLTTTAITDGNRTITATEDQATSGGQVGVRL